MIFTMIEPIGIILRLFIYSRICVKNSDGKARCLNPQHMLSVFFVKFELYRLIRQIKNY